MSKGVKKTALGGLQNFASSAGTVSNLKRSFAAAICPLPDDIQTQADPLGPVVAVAKSEGGAQRTCDRIHGRRKQLWIDVQVDLIARPNHSAPVDEVVPGRDAYMLSQLFGKPRFQLRDHSEDVALVQADVASLG